MSIRRDFYPIIKWLGFENYSNYASLKLKSTVTLKIYDRKIEQVTGIINQVNMRKGI